MCLRRDDNIPAMLRRNVTYTRGSKEWMHALAEDRCVCLGTNLSRSHVLTCHGTADFLIFLSLRIHVRTHSRRLLTGNGLMESRATLVIVPSSLSAQWVSECNKWAPHVSFFFTATLLRLCLF